MVYKCGRLSSELRLRNVDPKEVLNFPKNNPYVVIEALGFTLPRETNLVAGYIGTRMLRAGNVLNAIEILKGKKTVKKFIVHRTESGLKFRIE